MQRLIAPLFLALVTPAIAQDALTLSAVRHAQEGYSTASMTFHPNVDGHIAVRLSCGGRTYTLDTDIAPGVDQPLTLDGLRVGSHDCQGSLTLRASDGTEGSMPLSLGVQILPPLKLAVAPEALDLEGRRLTVTAGRPLSKVEVTVLGVGGQELGAGEAGAAGTEALLTWSQRPDEAIKLVITGYDEHGLPGQLELSPWSYDIPHEDVVFASGQHAITNAANKRLTMPRSTIDRE